MAGKKTIELNTGAKMPAVGLGTWKSQPGEVQLAVEAAIDAGYKHIDCAAVYGNEKEVGAGLKNKIGTVINREDLWVTSKLWNTKHAQEDVVPALKQTLSDLGLGYLDLYLIHWPHAFKRGDDPFPKDAEGNMVYDDQHFVDTWKGMEECVRLGLAKNIGMSNFNSKQMQQVLDVAEISPSVLQVECHPYLTQDKLIDFCASRGIKVTAYSPLGSPDRPFASPDDPALLEDPRLADIATKHAKSPAQVLIRFQVQRGVAVIPKSINPARIKANLDVCYEIQVFDFELSAEEMETIENFNRNFRFVALTRDKVHPHYPFSEEF